MGSLVSLSRLANTVIRANQNKNERYQPLKGRSFAPPRLFSLPSRCMASVISLSLENNSISNVSALSNLENFTQLNLSQNNLSNLSDLSPLAQLKWLDLDANQITDTSPLASLTELQFLDLSDNQISEAALPDNLR